MSTEEVRPPCLIVHSYSSTCSECRLDSQVEGTHTAPAGYQQEKGCGAIYEYVTTDMGGKAAAEATQRIADELGLPFKNLWGNP